MKRALTRLDVVVCLVIIALVASTLLPMTARLRGSSGESISISNLQTLSYAHALYAWDWSDEQITWVPNDAGQYTVQWGGQNWYVAYFSLTGICPPPQILGWDDDPEPKAWSYFLPCVMPGFPSGNYVAYQPNSWASGNVYGAFRLPNAEAFHAYVDGRFYSETFYTPTDTKTWELASYAIPDDGTFSMPPPLGEGSYPEVVMSSYCLSPSAMWNPEVLSLNAQTGKWYKAPHTSVTGYESPTASQCTYPDLKTRMIEHNWNIGQPSIVNPQFFGNQTPYFFNHGIAATPVTLFFDGHIEVLPNAQVVADDATVLAGTGGAVGLWTRHTPLGTNGYLGQVSYDGTLVSHHILTASGILGRDVLGIGRPAPVDGTGRPSGNSASHEHDWPSTSTVHGVPLRPPGHDAVLTLK